ncbi:hypothetical protein [Hallella multisaccharivorax]
MLRRSTSACSNCGRLTHRVCNGCGMCMRETLGN